MSDYFSQQVNTGQPIVPPTPAQAPVVPQQPVVPGGEVSAQPQEYVGLPVRAVGDRVFLLRGGKKHWVSTPEAYNNLGFKFGDEVKIDQATLDVLPDGEPIK